MPDDIETTLPRRQLGQYLREARQAANMTLEQVAPIIQWSTSKLQRVEKGQSPRVRDLDVEALCRIYDVAADRTEGYIGLAQQANVPEWWHAYGDLIVRHEALLSILEVKRLRGGYVAA